MLAKDDEPLASTGDVPQRTVAHVQDAPEEENMIRDREIMEHLWLYTPTAATKLDESNYSSQHPTAVRRLTRACIVAALLALLLMSALVAFGQTGGKIAGTVKDATGQRVLLERSKRAGDDRLAGSLRQP